MSTELFNDWVIYLPSYKEYYAGADLYGKINWCKQLDDTQSFKTLDSCMTFIENHMDKTVLPVPRFEYAWDGSGD